VSGRELASGPGGAIARRSRGLAARGLRLAERLEDPRLPSAPLPHAGAFGATALSADGRWVAAARSGSAQDRGLLLAALDGSGEVREALADSWIRSVRFLGDETDLLAATQQGEVVQIALDGERLIEVARRRCPAGAADPPRTVEVAPDGAFAAVLLGSGTIVGLPWPEGAPWSFDLRRELANGSVARLACAFEPAPAGKLAVVCDRVLVFDRSGSGGRLASLAPDLAGGPSALCWSGSELLVVEGAELLRVPLLGGGPRSRTLAAAGATDLGRAAISPGGRIIALHRSAHAGEIDLHAPTGEPLARRPASPRGVEALAVADDGRLAVAEADGGLTVWAPGPAAEPLLRMRDRPREAGRPIAAG